MSLQELEAEFRAEEMHLKDLTTALSVVYNDDELESLDIE